MKKLLPLLFVLMGLDSGAQIVNIPDANFKYALVHYSDIFGREIDTNHDGEIQVAEALGYSNIGGGYFLYIGGKNIHDITGIQAFTGLKTLALPANQLTTFDLTGLSNLETLFCHSNNLTSIDLSACTQLKSFFCDNNQLATLNLTGLTNLIQLFCSNNNFTSLDVSGNTLLREIHCNNNQLTMLDLSQNPGINILDCSNNLLTSLNVKNGAVFNYNSSFFTFESTGNPALQYVCADNGEVLYMLNYFVNKGMGNVEIDENCSTSASPGYGSLQGVAKVDLDINGCTPADNGKLLFPIKLINDNNTTQNLITNTDSFGVYTFHAYPGSYSLVPRIQIPYYTINPDTIHFTSVAGIMQNMNFCIVPTGVYNDLDVKIDYVAAFEADTVRMQITYKNKGTQPISGTVQLGFDDDKMDFLGALIPTSSQSTGNVSWDFADLQPFETRKIESIYLKLLPPPIVSIGDTLNFVTNIGFAGIDETPADNVFIFRAPVTYSLLPITMEYLKGSSSPGKNYLNWKATCTSTKAAFEIQRSVDGIHFRSIGNTEGDYLRCQQPFDFTDNNPFTGINYYRIKMIDIDGKASYSTIIALLNKKSGFEIVNLLPNPVTNGKAILNITSAQKQQMNIMVTDALGRSVYAVSQTAIAGATQVEMNFSNLSTGVYTITINTGEGERKLTRFVKE